LQLIRCPASTRATRSATGVVETSMSILLAGLHTANPRGERMLR
jgi:hypothetical protein